jgi:DNA-binding NarL/FixJ family response regulator
LARGLLTSDADAERDYGKRLIAEAEQLASRFTMAGLAAAISEILQDGASRLPDGLTPREADVLKLLAIGRSNKDISTALAISLSTVATHIRSILTKAGCANRTEAAAYAMRHELN